MPETTSPGQRFVQLIQELGLSKNAFAQSLGKTATVIQHLVDERNKPGFDLLSKVLEVYPNVSSDWLLLGQGAMLRTAAQAKLVAAETPTMAPTIDLETVGAPPRRRAAPHGSLLQPADIAATVALAATHAPPRQPTPPAFPAPLTPTEAAIPAEAVLLEAPQLGESVPPAPPVAPPVIPASPQPPVATPAPSILPDPAYLAALLQAQHLQHQLALAEQRNQHLLEQQALLKQMVQLLQRPSRTTD